MNLSSQLQEALANGAEISVTDDEIFAAAAEVAKLDPKRRFTAYAIKKLFAERHNVEYVTIPNFDRRVRMMSEGPNRRFVPAVARGYYQIPKESTAKDGVSFKASGGGAFDIFFNGVNVGEIIVTEGEYIGATRSRKKAYQVDLDVDGRDFSGANTPPLFDALTDAKKWVMKALAR